MDTKEYWYNKSLQYLIEYKATYQFPEDKKSEMYDRYEQAKNTYIELSKLSKLEEKNRNELIDIYEDDKVGISKYDYEDYISKKIWLEAIVEMEILNMENQPKIKEFILNKYKGDTIEEVVNNEIERLNSDE